MEGESDSELKLFHSSCSSIQNSVEYVDLQTLLASIHENKEEGKPLQLRKASQLQLLTEKVVQKAEETKDGSLFPTLIKSIKLQNESTTTRKVTILENQNTELRNENEKLKQELSRLSIADLDYFEASEIHSQIGDQTTKHDIENFNKSINTLNSKLNAKKDTIYQQTLSIQELTEENEKLTRMNKRKVEKIQKLEEMVVDKDQEIRSLQFQIEKIASEKPTQQDHAELEFTESQKASEERLYQLFDKLIEDKEEESKQIIEISNQRNKLYSLAKRMSDAMERLEIYNLKLPNFNKVNEIQQERIDTEYIVEKLKALCNESEIEMEILGNQSMDPEEKIIKIVTLLKESHQKCNCQSIQNLNKSLINIICSVLRYIQDLSNNKDIQMLTVEAGASEEIRGMLVAAASRINSFIRENKIDYDRVSGLFDYLTDRADPMAAPNYIESYLARFNAEEDPQSQELFLIICQLLSANDILRKYAYETRTIAARCTSEMKGLRSELQRRDAENITLQSKLTDVEKELQNRIIPQVAEKDNTELESLKKQIKDLKRENSVIAEMKIQLQNAKEAVNDMQEATKKREEKIAELTDELTKRAENAEEERSSLIQKVAELEELIESGQAERERERTYVEEECEALREEVRGMAADTCRRLGELRGEGAISVRAAKHDMKKMLAFIRDSKSKVSKFVNNYVFENNETIQTLTKQTELLRNSNALLEADLSKERTDHRSDREKLYKACVKARSLETSKASVLESAQRETALMKRQHELQIRLKDAEIEQRVDSVKAEFQRDMHDFCMSVSRLFKEFVDITQSITKDSTLKVLESASKSIQENRALLENSKKSENELDRIRRAAGAKSSDNIVDIIRNNAIKLASLERTERENERLRREGIEARKLLNKSEESEEWNEWSRRVSAIVFPAGAPSSGKAIRKSLEDVIFGASDGGVSSTKKLALLRDEKAISSRWNLPTQRSLSTKNGAPSASLNAVIDAIAFVIAVQKSSGHSRGGFSGCMSATGIDLGMAPPGRARGGNKATEKREYRAPQGSLFAQFVIDN